MKAPHDPNVTTDLPSALADSLQKTVTTDSAPGAATSNAQASDLPAVPGYRVFRAIARGGMGRVLAAIQTGVDEWLVPLEQQAIQVDLIDSDGAVCFALHGDDLPHVDW